MFYYHCLLHRYSSLFISFRLVVLYSRFVLLTFCRIFINLIIIIIIIIIISSNLRLFSLTIIFLKQWCLMQASSFRMYSSTFLTVIIAFFLTHSILADFKRIAVTDQALLIYCSAKNFVTIKHA
jgi:hypothetical protein